MLEVVLLTVLAVLTWGLTLLGLSAVNALGCLLLPVGCFVVYLAETADRDPVDNGWMS